MKGIRKFVFRAQNAGAIRSRWEARDTETGEETMASIELTPEVLRALGEGLSALSDGDVLDGDAVDSVEILLEGLGYLRSGLTVYKARDDEIQERRAQQAEETRQWEVRNIRWMAHLAANPRMSPEELHRTFE